MEEKDIKEEQQAAEAQNTKDSDTKAETQQTENENADNEQEKKSQDKKDEKRRRHHHDDKSDELTEKLQKMGEQLAEMNDKYVRSVAEFENYRKRTNAERADLILNGGKDVIKSVLPILDDFERALSAITDENAKEGVNMIYSKLVKTLEQKGLKAMDAKGQKFDENFHEAVAQVPAPTEEQKGTVLEVVEKGYYLNDKVLRYAKVVYAM